jgi:hypothetical protein
MAHTYQKPKPDHNPVAFGFVNVANIFELWVMVKKRNGFMHFIHQLPIAGRITHTFALLLPID